MKKTVLSIFAFLTLSAGSQAEAGKYELRFSQNPTEIAIQSYGHSLEITHLPVANTRIQVSNLAGQVVGQFKSWPENGRLTLDLVGVPNGIYLISIENEKGLKTVRKIMIG